MISHAEAVSLLEKWRVEETPVNVLLNTSEARASFVGRIVELDTGCVAFRPTDPNPSSVEARVDLSAATFEWGDRREWGERFRKAVDRLEKVIYQAGSPGEKRSIHFPHYESFLMIFLPSGAAVCVAEIGNYNR